MSESTANPDKKSDFNKDLETMMEPLKVYLHSKDVKIITCTLLHIILYYSFSARTGTIANKVVSVPNGNGAVTV